MRSRPELERLAAEAMSSDDVEARAARLFVLASELLAMAGDEAEAALVGRRWLEQAAHDGSSHAALELGLLMTAGRGGAVEPEAGIAWVTRAADAGVSVAALLLGGTLLATADRAVEGVAWLRRAAAAEEWSALWLLGSAHLRGLGVAPDAAQARLLFHVAAQHGVVEAQLELATLYGHGIGGARDEAAAARWEQSAAEAGHATGCLRVAERALAQPGGVARALPWLERAAAGGSGEAAARLAELHRDGRELPRDDAAVARWRARAAELGYAAEEGGGEDG